MKIPQIRLESKIGKTNIVQTTGKQEIQQKKAELSIKQPQAQITMLTTPSKLIIDQTQAWEEANLMSTLRRIENYAQEGMKGSTAGTERRAQQGSELMKIENTGTPIHEQALINGFKQRKPLGLKFIPSPFSVKINVESSQIYIDTVVNQPIIEVKNLFSKLI